MTSGTDTALALLATLPALYGIGCWLRRFVNAHKAARWVKQHHAAAWQDLHWLARRNAWAGVEVLISKGLILGPEVDEFRRRDEKLETATWVGLLVSAALLVAFGVLKILYAVLA